MATRHRANTRAPRRVRAASSGMSLYANPYDTTRHGFYFNSLEDFEAKFEKNRPVEEYEIDFIEGTSEEAALFKVAHITQANLEDWFNGLDELEDHQLPAVYFLLDNGNVDSFRDAIDKASELSFGEGDTKEYVERFVDDMGGPSALGKKTLEQYFDYDSYAHDMELNGEVVEFTFGGTTYTADPNSV